MSWIELDSIASEHPQLTAVAARLRDILSQRGVNVLFRVGETADFMDAPLSQVEFILQHAVGDHLGAHDAPICPDCDRPIDDRIGQSDERLFCDVCERHFPRDTVATETCYYLKVSVTGSRWRAGAGRGSTMANPLKDEALCRQYRIQPWRELTEAEYVVQGRQLGRAEQDRVMENLQIRGVCLIRFDADIPTQGRLESLEQWIGPLRAQQNDFTGKVKSIVPKANVEPVTGDSAKALGPHVDGTQDTDTPALLGFQYASGPTWGGVSTFYDMAAILGELNGDRLDFILKSLARHDAARCTKRKQQGDGKAWEWTYVGPLVKPVCAAQAVAVRVRLDDVMTVIPDCQPAFDELKAAIQAWPHRLSYTPHEGDIVVFDNWRVLHGREAIGGWHQRIHDRIWVDTLGAQHHGRCLLGVRPLGNALMAAIEAAAR